MEEIIYSSNQMTLQRPKLRRRGAGLKFFTSPGNTQDQFDLISSYLKNEELITRFFNHFDNLIGKSFTNYDERIDSFTHSWLCVEQLLAIIGYLDNTFLNIFTFECNDLMNNLYIDAFTYSKFNKEYNGDDQSKRINIVRDFLNF
jgi:hypothetical protein